MNNLTETVTENDISDIAHLEAVPYVDAITMDRNTAALPCLNCHAADGILGVRLDCGISRNFVFAQRILLTAQAGLWAFGSFVSKRAVQEKRSTYGR